MDGNAMELISGLMNNPDTIEQIKNIIGNMKQNENQSNTEQKTNPNEYVSQSTVNNAVPDLSFISNLLSSNSQSIEIMNKMKRAYDVYSDTSDPDVNLLTALTPYLSSTRIKNIEKVKTIIKFGKATTVFTKR